MMTTEPTAEDMAYEAAMQAEWDALTDAKRAEIIAEQDAAARVSAERHAERALSFGYAS